jgi:MYXO-CTERM domain-containing protein
VAFDSLGDLFVGNAAGGATGQGTIVEIKPGGARSVFATGLNNPQQLAFNNAGDLFEADFYSGKINEFTPGGTESTFASGLAYPSGLAFQGTVLPVPEPTSLAFAGLCGLAALAATRRRRN